MGCLQIASFVILINGAPSYFFKASRGLRQGCLLSPFLFLIITKALSRLLKEARQQGALKGVNVPDREEVTHLQFVDDIFYSVKGTFHDARALKDSLDLL